MAGMPDRVLVIWTSADGEEHEEHWANVDTFLSWAHAEGLRCAWRAYEEDEDGDWLVIGSGRVGL